MRKIRDWEKKLWKSRWGFGIIGERRRSVGVHVEKRGF